jgi:hypothetical protein
MKIKVIVKFDDHERHFFVACGTGEKTFKWLGNVASQRYAQAIPNGNLRRREDFCGVTDGAQFHTLNIVLPTGSTASPMEIINEHLHDEDTVILELGSRLPIDNKTGTPKHTQFANLAYTTSQEKFSSFDNEEGDEESYFGNRTASEMSAAMSKTSLGSPTSPPESVSIPMNAKANFMRVLLKSQTLNEPKISKELEKHWKIIESIIKLIKRDDIPHIKTTFFQHWDLLIDIFEFYSSNNPNHHSNVAATLAPTNGGAPVNPIAALSFTTNYYQQIVTTYRLEKNDFINLVEDCNIFPAIQLTSQVNLIYQRTCQLLSAYYSSSSSSSQKTAPMTTFNFTGFLLSLLLTAQLKYNDTLDAKMVSSHSYESIDRLIVTNFVHLGKHINCRSLLKREFLTVPFLSKIKDNYQVLHSNFDKMVMKSKDIPLTISIEDVTELAYNSSLLMKKDDYDFIKLILLEIRKGNIHGRSMDDIPSESMKTLISQQTNLQHSQNYYYKDEKDRPKYINPNDIYPANEFTFPEFIEGIARIGYYYYTKTNPVNPVLANPITNLTTGTMIDDPQQILKLDISEYLFKGIQDVCDFLTGKKLKPQQGQSKKGKKPTTAGEAK